MRFPVASKIAFSTAGVIGGTPISPIPEGGSELGDVGFNDRHLVDA